MGDRGGRDNASRGSGTVKALRVSLVEPVAYRSPSYHIVMHNHAVTHAGHRSRRDFFHTLLRGALAGASILELAHYRAAWARSLASTAGAPLFDIRKVA